MQAVRAAMAFGGLAPPRAGPPIPEAPAPMRQRPRAAGAAAQVLAANRWAPPPPPPPGGGGGVGGSARVQRPKLTAGQWVPKGREVGAPPPPPPIFAKEGVVPPPPPPSAGRSKRPKLDGASVSAVQAAAG